MKLWVVCVLSALCSSVASAESLIWAGVDLGELHLVGPESVPGTGRAWPKEHWPMVSLLFNRELSGYQRETLGEAVGLRTQVSGMHVEHHGRFGERLTVDDRDELLPTSPRLSKADIVDRVATYPRDHLGLAAVLIGDQWNTRANQGCYWLTFFDTDTGAVREATFLCGAPSSVKRPDPAMYWLVSARRVLEGLSQRELPPARAMVIPEGDCDVKRSPQERLQQSASRVELAEAEARILELRLELDRVATLLHEGVEPAECITFYGETACGYDCKTARRSVLCSPTPNGKCVVRFGKIYCSP